MEKRDIVTSMLLKLDGWVLDNKDNEDLQPTKYNKKIKSSELLHYYDMATDYALSYTQRPNLDDVYIADTALVMWASGLIWNKYNLRSNEQVDETNSFGFGDKLIVQAKEMLKPYKSYSFQAY